MRKVRFAEGEFYHVFNRGVDKRIIFQEPSDYKRFIAYLHLLNTQHAMRPSDIFDQYNFDEVFNLGREKPIVAIGAYCLMPNHFHLYLTPFSDDGISKFMQRVQTAYTMYFNERRERSGVLLQGAFKAVHVNRDPYAKYIVSYIHLNPASLVDPDWKMFGPQDFTIVRDHVRAYPYSSIGEYISGKHRLIDLDPFPRYITSQRDISDHINTWLEFKSEGEEVQKRVQKRKHVKSVSEIRYKS